VQAFDVFCPQDSASVVVQFIIWIHILSMDVGHVLERPCCSAAAHNLYPSLGMRRVRCRSGQPAIVIASYTSHRTSGLGRSLPGGRKFELGVEFAASATTAVDFQTFSGASPGLRSRSSNSFKARKLRVAVDVDEGEPGVVVAGNINNQPC